MILMFDKLNLLAISVSDINNQIMEQPVDETPKKVFWIVILILVILICTFAARYMSETKEAIRIKKKENEQKKHEKAREEELERLHKIKEKNKRK